MILKPIDDYVLTQFMSPALQERYLQFSQHYSQHYSHMHTPEKTNMHSHSLPVPPISYQDYFQENLSNTSPAALYPREHSPHSRNQASVDYKTLGYSLPDPHIESRSIYLNSPFQPQKWMNEDTRVTEPSHTSNSPHRSAIAHEKFEIPIEAAKPRRLVPMHDRPYSARPTVGGSDNRPVSASSFQSLPARIPPYDHLANGFQSSRVSANAQSKLYHTPERVDVLSLGLTPDLSDRNSVSQVYNSKAYIRSVLDPELDIPILPLYYNQTTSSSMRLSTNSHKQNRYFCTEKQLIRANNAALKIQHLWRGYRSRCIVKRKVELREARKQTALALLRVQNRSAVKIQAQFRGLQCRLRFIQLRNKYRKKNQSALVLQKIMQGNSKRVSHSFLFNDPFYYCLLF